MAELVARLQVQQDGEARLRFAAEAGRLGVWELDARTGELATSPMCRRMFGRDPELAFSYADLCRSVHLDDQARVQAALQHSAATGADCDIEFRVVRPGGAVGWIQMRAQVARGDDGAPGVVAGVSFNTTDRRAADMRLALSEQSLRLATEAAQIGTWDLDLVSDRLTWSDRTRAMFGISPGMPCSMVDFYTGLHPEDAPATAAAFASAIDPGRRSVYDVEYRTVGREDSVVRWVAAKGAGLFEDDRCVRAVGTAIDITARKTAGERQSFRLELSDRLRTLTDPHAIMREAGRAIGRALGANRVGHALLQPDGLSVVLETHYVDGVAPLDGLYRLDWFGPAAVDGRHRTATAVSNDVTLDPSFHPANWASIDARALVAAALIRNGKLWGGMFVHGREPRAWTEAEVALIDDAAARTWDAAARAQAEAELRQSNERLERLVADRTATLQASEARMRTVFETSYQLLGLLAPDGTVLDINPTALSAIQAHLDDVVGLPFWDTPWFAPTPGMKRWMQDAIAAAARGDALRQEITVALPGGLRSFDFSLRPVRAADGAVVAIVPESVDITDRLLTEEALRQAQKMEAVGQLTGGIAHDFNNLLTGITGSLELIQRRVAAGRTEGLDRYASAAITSAQRAAALTQRLLAFARRQPLDPRLVEANRLVAGIEELLRRTLGAGIDLEMVLSGELWATLCDPNQLESAILNLAINARDAMPNGGRLTIETANAHLDDGYARAQAGEVRPGPHVLISVTDTGIGMSPDVIEKAFDPFFTTKPTGQGTGLGLSMLYGFVKQSEGHVRIYSEPGRGTTFKLYLPRHRGAAEDQPDGLATPGVSLAAEAGETVLVVDDEPTIRLLVQETLQELGYAAIEAGDGASALRLVQSDTRIDLLVTDVGMPILNGRQLADAARLVRPELPVLFMTGYAHNAAIGQGAALEPGMEIISKPFALDALARKIREMIEN